jgi:hypothetical protein
MSDAASNPPGPIPAFATITGIVLGGNPDGEHVPLFRCDRCGQDIRHADKAVIEWDTPAEDAATLPSAYARHQDCQTHLARWLALDIFLMQLGWNSGMPAAKISGIERQGGTRGLWS